jgi:hypothetical protein
MGNWGSGGRDGFPYRGDLPPSVETIWLVMNDARREVLSTGGVSFL